MRNLTFCKQRIFCQNLFHDGPLFDYLINLTRLILRVALICIPFEMMGYLRVKFKLPLNLKVSRLIQVKLRHHVPECVLWLFAFIDDVHNIEEVSFKFFYIFFTQVFFLVVPPFVSFSRVVIEFVVRIWFVKVLSNHFFLETGHFLVSEDFSVFLLDDLLDETNVRRLKLDLHVIVNFNWSGWRMLW